MTESARYMDDCFIPSDCLLSETRNRKVDAWLFGVMMYCILFGNKPDSFLLQLKDWVDNHSNLKFEKISFPNNIINQHFFYNPFKHSILSDSILLSSMLLTSILLSSFG